MTISLARRQKLAAIAKAHDEWVDEHLAAVSSEFDPAAHPKEDSDYNQHNVDVDASGEAEDELAAMLANVLVVPMIAAGDPDWNPAEHPRGPDGKFIEDGAPGSLKDQLVSDLLEQISNTAFAKNIAKLKGDDYEFQALDEKSKKLHQQLSDIQAMPASAPKLPVAPKISSSASSTGGKPITAWTKTIYSGQYEDGQIVAVNKDGKTRLVWNADQKVFTWQEKTPQGGWSFKGAFAKKTAYEKFKGEKASWLTPSPGAMVIDDAPPPLSTSPLAAPKLDSSPQFKILPRNERGASGDGYFAGNFWGKYGAAGLMMRHTDEKGEERFLLVQANMMDNPDTFGKWQLPGGAIEELETPEQGAAREVFEELGFGQDFLYNMKQRETHKVTFDVPGFGPWSYSNIAVDVPTMPDPKFDPHELGGAKWFTRAEIDKMRQNGEIIKPLEANLDSVLSKFNDDPKVPDPTPIKNQPAPPAQVRPSKVAVTEPAPKAPLNMPTVSQQNGSSTTTWTKSKFNTTTAYKTSYENDEIVGFTKFGSSMVGGDAARILWKNGKFTREKWTGSSWQYDGAYTTKKSALAALDGQPFYKPHKGTLASENNDVFTGTDLIKGSTTLVKTESATPTINQPVSSPFVVLNSFSEDGTPFGAYKTSLSAKNLNGDKIGAIHEYSDGTWIAIGGHGRGPYVGAKLHATKEDAIQALADGDAAYIAAQLKAATPVINPASSSKKTPKLTAAQIEKQNGTVPKTLKSTQKSKFLKNFKEGSSFGFIKSDDPDAKKVFTALVEAVGNHNDTESPKLNFLQGLNVLDQVYGSKQKANVVAWLQTSEGKALAPGIVGGAGAGNGLVIPAPSSGVVGMKSAYEIGKPKKIHPSYFTSISRADARDMHEEMYKKTPLTKEQISIIKEYMGSSDDFNDPLRGTKNMTGWSQVNIAKLQSAMRPVTKSFTVWRGTDGLGTAINTSTINNLEDLKKFEGAVVGDPAFLSTSIEQYGSFSGKKFKLIVNVPEGTPATYAYASGGGAFENEQEMLLAAGLHFKIDRVSQPSTGGAYHIYMTVVPEAKQK